MKAYLVPISIVFLVLMAYSSVMACGTIEMAVRGYWGEGPMNFNSPRKNLTALSDTECVLQSTYKGKKSDIAILGVLLDVLDRHPSLRYDAKKVFLRWNCLYGARFEEGYELAVKALGNASCNNFENWMLITAANGANLRQQPNGKKLTVLPNNTFVSRMETQGDWFKVKIEKYPTLYNPQCRFESPCREGYLHKSVLRKY
ncbi:hypothetical protein ACFL4N_04470 [Thermodesulfobacteriota bacterium]